MNAKNQLHRGTQKLAENDVQTAQRYLESLYDLREGPLSPEEIEEIEHSINEIRRGEMTLEEFEQKYGF